MKKEKLLLAFLLSISFVIVSCASTSEQIPENPMATARETTTARDRQLSLGGLSVARDRQLSLDGLPVSEDEFGGVERWYAVDKYNLDGSGDEVRFQVGYFKKNNIGFVLYGNGTAGVVTYFSRQGLDLRWDWGDDGNYCFVIKPDDTGLYYDFSASNDGTAKPRGIYKVHKF